MTDKKYLVYIVLISAGFSILLISSSFMMYGTNLNNKAIRSNDCKMPVISIVDYETERHRHYADHTKINNIHLVDIYPYRGWMYSIGDIIIIIGQGLLILGVIILVTTYSNLVISLIKLGGKNGRKKQEKESQTKES
jgi:hypothetical protein